MGLFDESRVERLLVLHSVHPPWGNELEPSTILSPAGETSGLLLKQRALVAKAVAGVISEDILR
jgi:hypothetical protein